MNRCRDCAYGRILQLGSIKCSEPSIDCCFLSEQKDCQKWQQKSDGQSMESYGKTFIDSTVIACVSHKNIYDTKG